jgi:hypothetical protein
MFMFVLITIIKELTDWDVMFHIACLLVVQEGKCKNTRYNMELRRLGLSSQNWTISPTYLIFTSFMAVTYTQNICWSDFPSYRPTYCTVRTAGKNNLENQQSSLRSRNGHACHITKQMLLSAPQHKAVTSRPTLYQCNPLHTVTS